MATTGERGRAGSKWWLRIVPENAHLLRSSTFWAATAVGFVTVSTFSILFSFSDPIILGAVITIWFGLCATLSLKWISDFRVPDQGAPTLDDIERWRVHEMELRGLYAKVRAGTAGKIKSGLLAKKGHSDLNWKREALASATVSIRSRSYFREGEERVEESAIASQDYGSR